MAVGASVDLAAALRRVARGGVYDDRRRRAEYATDASNYRVIPQAVVEPLDADDVLAVVGLCRDRSIPLTSRGGGTSIAGNAIGPGVVLDFSKHMNTILALDPERRAALVQPGVVLGALQRRAAPFGLRFGPDPSSASRATLGGMIGNNSCGAHALAYGRTADNIESMSVVTGSGLNLLATQGSVAVPALNALVDADLQILRTELATFSRQGSGFALEHLLPERGRHLARALAGSEGTLAVTLEATVRLVPISPARLLVVLGYADMAAAADAVPALLLHAPLALEGLDSRLVDVLRRDRGQSPVPELPRGSGWLLVEVGGADAGAAVESANALLRGAGAVDSRVLPAGEQAIALWRIREDAAGLAGRTIEGRQAWPGWEDAAVPPQRLGSYLREFEELLEEFHLHGLPYGHFGDGCIHVRIGFGLERDATAFRDFVFEAAQLAVRHGGSFSGEHGDGRARSELLPLMFSERMVRLFGSVKRLFDPDNLLNPGVLVDPDRIDANLRRPRAHPIPARGGFAFRHDGGDFTNAVHRCVGVAKCRADNAASGGFMCPSWLATKDEKDSTRGRARVLQELTNGSLITSWSSSELHESLDLCLSCKACSSDCPAGVDMAQYKSEVLYRRYRHRPRPPSHYSLGWLPRWLDALDRVPGAAVATNSLLRWLPSRSALLALAGIDHRRRPPAIARQSFLRGYPHRQRLSDNGRVVVVNGSERRVVLWVDSFTNGLSPELGKAAVQVMTKAGFDIVVPEDSSCCGLTWVTTGQLTAARRRLRRLLDVLSPYAEDRLPIVGLEPSCVATLRSDLLELLPEDPRSILVATSVRTLAELLHDIDVDARRLPDLGGLDVVVQPHCHHHSVLGFGNDEQLLRDCGASIEVLAGCCGLAGNWGMERGHYDVSVAIAEHSLLPALRANPSAHLLADGFSCRTQIADLTGRRALHLAELLADPPQGPARRARQKPGILDG